jgi:hypothetical protein
MPQLVWLRLSPACNGIYCLRGLLLKPPSNISHRCSRTHRAQGVVRPCGFATSKQHRAHLQNRANLSKAWSDASMGRAPASVADAEHPGHFPRTVFSLVAVRAHDSQRCQSHRMCFPPSVRPSHHRNSISGNVRQQPSHRALRQVPHQSIACSMRI